MPTLTSADGRVLVQHVAVSRAFGRGNAKGLLGRDGLAAGHGLLLADMDNVARHVFLEFAQPRVVGGELLGHRALGSPAAQAECQRRQREYQAGVENESTNRHCVLRICWANAGGGDRRFPASAACPSHTGPRVYG